MWCWRRILGVSWREHRTNESVLLEELGLESYIGHVVRGSARELSLAVTEGPIDGVRYQGAPKRCWINDTLEWSGKTYKELKTVAQR